MKKQTAIDYLFNEIFYKSDITGEYVLRSYKNLEYYLDRAKQIEKKHITDAYLAGNKDYLPFEEEYFNNNFTK